VDMGEFGVRCGKAACDVVGIERISLGQLSLGAGEAAHSCRTQELGGKCQPIERIVGLRS
jgi:hypothetical protein